MIGDMLVGLMNGSRDRVVHAVSALVAVPVAATTTHALGISADLNTANLYSGLLEPSLWATLGFAALFGALGGIVAELMSLHGRIEVPHHVRRNTLVKRSRLADPRYEIDLGIFSRMLCGASAALALLAVITPGSAPALLVNSLIAGSAATAVFRLVQGRMLAKARANDEKATRSSANKSLRAVA